MSATLSAVVCSLALLGGGQSRNLVNIPDAATNTGTAEADLYTFSTTFRQTTNELLQDWTKDRKVFGNASKYRFKITVERAGRSSWDYYQSQSLGYFVNVEVDRVGKWNAFAESNKRLGVTGRMLGERVAAYLLAKEMEREADAVSEKIEAILKNDRKPNLKVAQSVDGKFKEIGNDIFAGPKPVQLFLKPTGNDIYGLTVMEVTKRGKRYFANRVFTPFDPWRFPNNDSKDGWTQVPVTIDWTNRTNMQPNDQLFLLVLVEKTGSRSNTLDQLLLDIPFSEINETNMSLDLPNPDSYWLATVFGKRRWEVYPLNVAIARN